jgi:outer membrane protein TolC
MFPRLLFSLLIVCATIWKGSTALAAGKKPPKAPPSIESKPSAPATLRLTQRCAIQMALARNFTLEFERFDPKLVSQNVRIAAAEFDPRFDFSVNYSEQNTRDLFSAGRHTGVDNGTTDTSWSLGLGGLTPFGTTYDLAYDMRRSSQTSITSEDRYTSEVTVALRQPLLRNAGTDANLASLRIARTSLRISEWGLRGTVMDIITGVIEAYNELYQARLNLGVTERSRELARRLYLDNLARVDIGVGRPLDVTTARAEVAAREEAVLVAERQLLDRENFLKQLITNDVDRFLATRVMIEPPVPPPFEGTVEKGLRDAFAMRPDYRQFTLDLERRKVTVAFQKNQLLPRLDLTASLALLGLDNDAGTSLTRVGNRDRAQYSAGLIFSVPIGNREAQSRLETARLEAARALVNLHRLEQDIVVDVDNAYGAVRTAVKRIASNEEALRLAKESLDASEERLRAGVGTTFEVLELQDRFSRAEFQLLRARTDYRIAIARFQRSVGSTLHDHNVEVPAAR